MASMSPSIEACTRCGRPAELPIIGERFGAARHSVRVPRCQECLELLVKEAEAFWPQMREKPDKGLDKAKT
jgi:hypothetical protein